MTDAEAAVVESTAVELHDHPGGSPPANLFKADDPVQVVERATEVADALKRVIASRGMVTQIQGRDHVTVDGWQTLGSMLGVTAVCEWTRPVADGWEARVLARTLDGRTIGAAEAQCTRGEKMWSKRDDYALRSMAQTRATSKALKGPLGFVVKLAGFEPTPADEMPADSAPAAAPAAMCGREDELAARKACAYLLNDQERAGEVAAWLVKDQGGFPRAAARLVIALERAMRSSTDVPAADPEPTPAAEATLDEVPF